MPAIKAAKIPFAKQRLEALPPPSKGRVYHYDAATPGLALCVTANDSRAFYYVRKIKGRTTRVRLGGFPDITVEAARKQVAALAGAVAAGRDPQAEKQAARHEHTVKGMFDFWLETHAKPHKKTWREDERMYEAFLNAWASRPLSSIRKQDIQTIHAKIGQKNGTYAANRLLSLLAAMFGKARDMGYTGGNPAEGVRRFKEEPRDRFMSADELQAFFVALAEENELFQAFFLLCLLTGARRSNVEAMRWHDVDLGIGLWRIPETKSGKPVVVPLSEQAVTLLRLHHEHQSPASEWVFPSPRRDTLSGHIVEPKSAWKRVLKRAKLENLRVHDLRRTMGSWQAITGASLPVIGKSLGHTQSRTTAIYSRLTLDPVRESVCKATDAILIGGNATIEVDGLRLNKPPQEHPEAEAQEAQP